MSALPLSYFPTRTHFPNSYTAILMTCITRENLIVFKDREPVQICLTHKQMMLLTVWPKLLKQECGVSFKAFIRTICY